jgi:gliding motility-associated-like protein
MKIYTRILLLSFVLFAGAFTARAGVVAGFTAAPTAGCSPLVVYFTNTSTGATHYKWIFGNGDSSVLTSPSTSYITPGTYTAKLIAYDALGNQSVFTMTITVYPAPTVSFTVSDTSICPGIPITFTSTTLGGVPGPITYVWAFGDGDTSSSISPTHSYAASGFYNITLTAKNADGCVSSLTKTAYVHVFTPAMPNFSSAITYFCKAPGHAVFSNFTTGTPGFTYKWSFGDGGTSTAANPTHDYLTTGSYTVKLVVTDGNGCTDSITRPAYIYVGNLKAGFTSVSTACVNTPVTFVNTSVPHGASEWFYGDGGTDTTGVHVYSTGGTYTVKLVVFDGACYDTITHTIVIVPGPVVSFTQTPLHPCPAPSTVTFIGTVPSGCVVNWNFGDGHTGTGATTSNTYGANGTYVVTMTVTDPATGCVSTAIRYDTIYDMIFNISASPEEGCVPLTVFFGHSEETSIPGPLLHPYPYPVSTYAWTFGDGGTSSGSTPTHVYTAEGIYTARLTITTSNGCTFTDTIDIKVGAPPIITVVAMPTHLCFGKTDSFIVTIVKGPADDFKWEFGDGVWIMDSLTHEYHIFALPGVFTVTVTPYFRGCPGPPYVIPTPITVDSPMAVIASTVLCYPRNRVDFGDSSLGDDTHMWMFGDGTTSTVDNPVHDYPAGIVYTVTLATYNKKSGCRDTISETIDLHRPVPDFIINHPICKDLVDTFTATYTGGGSIIAYAWHSIGISSDSNRVTYIDTFHIPGNIDVRLIVMDQNMCKDTVIKKMTVGFPAVTFSATPTSGCWPLTVVFTDHSTDAGGLTFSKYAWVYGDGGTTTLTSPSVSHTFTAAGTFSTMEVVTDNIGCKDSAVLPLITVYRPHASFVASNVYPCAGDSIQFTNTSVGIVSSVWMFGDGTTSTATSPWHTYPGPGFYTVSLAVKDVHGCTDTAVYPSYIYESQPVASFTMNDSFSICPPLTVNFTNTSTGASFYNWTFGDGGSSSAFSASDLYISIGLYTITLTATNSYGCTSVAIGHVNIFGYSGAFSYSPLSGCSPLTVHFSASISNVPNIIWDFADGNTVSVSMTDTIDHVYVLPGEYLPKLILSDNTGCQASSPGLDTIKVDAVYPGFTSIPNPICQHDSVNFKDTSSSYFSTITSRLWTFTYGDTSTAPAPGKRYDSVGTYPINLAVVDGWGCPANITEDIVVFPPAHITASPDTIICLTDHATLTGYGGVKYSWAPPATLSCVNCNPASATPDVVTTYTVTGTDQNGCVNTDTTTVFLKTKTISVAKGDTQSCQGVPVPLLDSGATKWTWIPATGLSNPFAANPWATPDVTTVYAVLAQLAGCIPDTNYVTVIVHPLPTVNAGPDQTLMEGSVAQLNATGTLINKVWWADPETLSCDSCMSPVASMSVTTTYVVAVATNFGCPASDSVTIHLFCDKSQIFVPNTFTPNGDGQNDVFYPRGKGISQIKSFRIYNRWGQLLFERSGIKINDAANAWDGSYLGSAPRPDVYVWIIDALCETGTPINIKGDVTIIK